MERATGMKEAGSNASLMTEMIAVFGVVGLLRRKAGHWVRSTHCRYMGDYRQQNNDRANNEM